MITKTNIVLVTVVMTFLLVAPGQTAQISFYPLDEFQGSRTNMRLESYSCYNLPSSIDNDARSINTHDNCILAFNHADCGSAKHIPVARIAPGTPSHNVLSNLNFHDKISSVRLCPPNCTQLTVNVNTTRASDMINIGLEMKQKIELWYTNTCNLLYSSNFQKINHIEIKFQNSGESWPDIADSSWTKKIIRANADYFRINPNDTSTLIHHVAHMNQQYRDQCPGWLTEGMADWMRYYHFDTTNIPKKPGQGSHYTDGYGGFAYCLNWIKASYPSIDSQIDKSCRDGTYTDDLFRRVTGRTLDRLWQVMMSG